MLRFENNENLATKPLLELGYVIASGPYQFKDPI
jgi:hypothetical protein